MSQLSAQDLLYTWNECSPEAVDNLQRVEIEDDSLRDGLQGAFVRKPSIEEKIELLEVASEVGIQGGMLGFPASSPQEFRDCLALVQAIEDKDLGIEPRFLARAHAADLAPIIELNKNSKNGVRADFFIGTSPMRRSVEGWELAELVAKVVRAGEFMSRSDTAYALTIEDATRTPPDDLRTVIKAGVDSGVCAFGVADTVGDSTPSGVRKLVAFLRETIADCGGNASILWHGHNDRGLALANSVAAAEAGAGIVGGSFLGIGERTGNVALEQFIFHLWQHGVSTYSLQPMVTYCKLLSQYTNTPLAMNQPIVGSQAFATCTGTHSAAVIKARAMSVGHEDYIFSSVPASQFGLGQTLLIGPTSGRANARYMLEQLGLATSPERIAELLAYAKTRDQWLEPDEIVAKFGSLVSEGTIAANA